MNRVFLALVLALICSTQVQSADWPQFRGPDRTDISKEVGLLKSWPASGPTKLWTSGEAGIGYSGFAVVGDSLFTMGAFDGQECVLALSVKDGSVKWRTKIGALLTNNWGDGPRGTPTVDGEFVYALSGPGDLACVKAADGAVVWQTSMKDFGGGKPNWGYCESVLIDGDKLVCTPGGSKGAMLALEKATGKPIWQSADFKEGAQYSSIVIAEMGGKRQYIQLTQKLLVGINAADGALLWSSPWEGRTAVIPTPIVSNGHVYIASGYGVGCKLVKVEGDVATDVYVNKVMKNHHGGVVLVRDHLYGYSDGPGLVCQNFLSGEEVWAEKKVGKGGVTVAEGLIYLLDEKDGFCILAEASPSGYVEHGRFKLDPQTKQRKPSGRIWTHPVIANGKLFLRDQELISCYDIQAK